MLIKEKKAKKSKPPTSVPHKTTTKVEKLILVKPDIMHCYLRHADINHYLEYVCNRYSSYVKLHTLGTTYEHRSLMGVEVDWCCPKNLLRLANQASAARRNNLARKMRERNQIENQVINVPVDRRNFVFIEGGTHAREWISISVALNCIYQLTERNLRHRDLLQKLRFFIVPVVNPDGYEYTLKKNRRWRKNRRPIMNSKNIGIDCNRNYDFNWESGPGKAHRCTYKGEAPFSETETQAMRQILHSLAPQLLFFLSLHSHAQSIMYPWGYSRDLPDVWQHLQKVALAGRNAIKKYSGRKYRCGSISEVTKRVISGSSVDYVFGTVRAPLALVMELPSDELGFQPPSELIQKLGNESWTGIRGMCKCAIELAPVVAPKLCESKEILVQENDKQETEKQTECNKLAT